MTDDSVRRWIERDRAKIIGRDVDGYYYFLTENGILPAHALRTLADYLDEINKPWDDIIQRLR